VVVALAPQATSTCGNLADRVPALNAQLYAEGVRPDAGEAVEMPGR
jgi:hypothetical protein